jgi:hypothetical protein
MSKGIYINTVVFGDREMSVGHTDVHLQTAIYELHNTINDYDMKTSTS